MSNSFSRLSQMVVEVERDGKTRVYKGPGLQSVAIRAAAANLAKVGFVNGASLFEAHQRMDPSFKAGSPERWEAYGKKCRGSKRNGEWAAYGSYVQVAAHDLARAAKRIKAH